MLHSRASLAMLVALAACGGDAGAPLAPSTAATSSKPSICAWGLGDNAATDLYLNSRMHEDGTFEISQYVNFSDPGFYIDSRPAAGLTTVYGDTVVLIRGSLPASSYSFGAGGEPVNPTDITLALDLRLIVTAARGTGYRPDGSITRFMRLSGTINGVQVGSGSDLSKKPAKGLRASPRHWSGSNGDVLFCH